MYDVEGTSRLADSSVGSPPKLRPTVNDVTLQWPRPARALGPDVPDPTVSSIVPQLLMRGIVAENRMRSESIRSSASCITNAPLQPPAPDRFFADHKGLSVFVATSQSD